MLVWVQLRAEATYFASVKHERTDARLVALADDCRVEKLSCGLKVRQLSSPER